jgi:hypothetical protein
MIDLEDLEAQRHALGHFRRLLAVSEPHTQTSRATIRDSVAVHQRIGREIGNWREWWESVVAEAQWREAHRVMATAQSPLLLGLLLD